MENETSYVAHDQAIKELIVKNEEAWDNIVKVNAPAKPKSKTKK